MLKSKAMFSRKLQKCSSTILLVKDFAIYDFLFLLQLRNLCTLSYSSQNCDFRDFQLQGHGVE